MYIYMNLSQYTVKSRRIESVEQEGPAHGVYSVLCSAPDGFIRRETPAPSESNFG